METAMKSLHKFRMSAVVVGVGAVLAVGVTTAVAKPPRPGGPGCICPTYYDPVLCSNGQTYSNQCFANCAGASGCVPVGPGPVPL
jgi:hypothetical protein